MISDPAACAKLLHGISALQKESDGSLRLSRVPLELLPSLNERVKIRGFAPAGSEIRFRMRGGPVSIRLSRIHDANPVFFPSCAVLAGVFRGDFQDSWHSLQEGSNVVRIEPFQGDLALLERNRHRYSPELVRVVLPTFPEIRLLGIEGDVEPACKEDSPAISYLAYGSSITQGAYTPLGNGGYPSVVARELGVDVLNLGFGGGAHLEPELAEWIAARDDWHMASLEMGINVFGIEVEEFRRRVRRFLSVFAADSKRRPVFCLDMIPFGAEIDGSESGKAAAFRRVVAEERDSLGASHLHLLEYAPALDRVADLSSDLLHPAAHAFESIGRNLAAQIKAILK